jgi:hypothetical protein
LVVTTAFSTASISEILLENGSQLTNTNKIKRHGIPRERENNKNDND